MSVIPRSHAGKESHFSRLVSRADESMDGAHLRLICIYYSCPHTHIIHLRQSLLSNAVPRPVQSIPPCGAFVLLFHCVCVCECVFGQNQLFNYLAGQRENKGPVLLPLLLSQGEMQTEALRVPRLPLLPASVEPGRREVWSL